MARSSVYQLIQIGPETTAGTAVAATKKLSALSIEPGPRVEVGTFRPRGTKFPTIAYAGKDWTEASVSGVATYTEIVYPLCSVLENVTPTGADSDKTWTFDIDADGADTYKTYTVEMGDSTTAEEFAYGTFTEFGMTFTRDSVELSGSMIGQLYTTGITLTPALSAIELVPVLPTDVDVYFADSIVGLDTLQLTNVLRAEWRISNRFSPYWKLDSSETSWGELVEAIPTLEVKLQMEANTAAMGYLANLRAGDARYIRIIAEGGTISAENYTLQLDTKCLFTDVSEMSDQDGVMALEYTFQGTPESTWAGPTQVIVINDLTAL